MRSLLTPVTERYLARLGAKAGTILLLTLLVWVSIGLGIVLYVTGRGILAVALLTRAAFDGPLRMAVAAAVWVFLALTAWLAWGLYGLWREHRRERWDADAALCRLERRLFATKRKPGGPEGPRERLAARALGPIEERLLGAPQASEKTIEERLIELDRQIGENDS